VNRLALAFAGFLLGATLVLLGADMARGDVIDGTKFTHGTLTTAQAATGRSTNQVCTGPPRTVGVPPTIVCGMGDLYALVVTYANASGTATVRMDVNCNGDGWIPVCNSDRALTIGSDGASVLYPGCEYACEVLNCAGCSVSCMYSIGLPIK